MSSPGKTRIDKRRSRKSKPSKSQSIYVDRMRFRFLVEFDDHTVGKPWLTIWYSQELNHIVAHCITQDAPKDSVRDTRRPNMHHPIERFFWGVQQVFESGFSGETHVQFGDLVKRFCEFFDATRTAVIKEELR